MKVEYNIDNKGKSGKVFFEQDDSKQLTENLRRYRMKITKVEAITCVEEIKNPIKAPISIPYAGELEGERELMDYVDRLAVVNPSAEC